MTSQITSIPARDVTRDIETASTTKRHAENLEISEDPKALAETTIIIDEAENKRLRRIIHRRVLPLMCLAYITQALDKGTLGPASIMGWIEDVGAKGQDYALTSTLLWAGIIVGEPLAGQLARRVPVSKVLAGAMFIWSGLLMGIGFSMSVPPVLVLRFFLGFSEAVFGPILVLITVQWYLKDEQPFVQAIWQSMLGGSGIFTAILAYAFYQVPRGQSPLYGWQWLHICVAIISFASAVTVWFFLPDSPQTARFASPELRAKFMERVRENNQGATQRTWQTYQARELLKDPLVYLLFGLAFLNTLVVGGVNTFNNLLISRGFGFDVLTTQLLSIPLAVVTVSLYMLMAYLVTKTKQTCLMMIAFTCVNIVCTVVLIVVAPTSSTRPGLIVAFYCMQAFQACNPCIFSLLSRNIAGQSKKSIAYATTFIGWAGGNAIAPQLFQSIWAPRYIPSLCAHLGLYVCFIAVAISIRFLLISRNRTKDAAQMTEDGTVVNLNERAFEDLTDRENPGFRYSY